MSERTVRSRAATREAWLDRIAHSPLSGLTPARSCAIEAASLPSFSSWKRRLAAEHRACSRTAWLTPFAHGLRPT